MTVKPTRRQALLRAAISAVAAYGMSVSYRATRNIIEVGEKARMGDREAQAHFTQTHYARVLGVRNSDLGIVYLGAVATAAATGLIRRRPVRNALLLGSVSSVAMSLYLLWALFFRLRVLCPICLKGHAVNATLFLLLLRQRTQ